MQDVVFVVVALVVVVFAFVVGSLPSAKDEGRSGRLEADLEAERRRAGELQAELERLRGEQR